MSIPFTHREGQVRFQPVPHTEPLMISEGFGDATAVFDVVNGFKLRSKGQGGATLDFTTISNFATLEAFGVGMATAFIRVNAEGNNFFELEAGGVGAASLELTKHVDLSCVVHGTSSATLSQDVQSNPEAEVIHFIIDILPALNVSRYRSYKVRCTINGDNLPISSFALQKSSVSSSFSARLANLADRALIDNLATFKFEIAETIEGSTTWRTIFDSSKLVSSSYSIGMSEQSPTDTFTFQVSSDLTTKLTKTPSTNIVYYDPFRTTVETEAIEVFYDIYDRPYASQVIAVSSMSLYKLFQKVFVEKCGFTQVVTNLPDFPIKRADFPFQRSFYESFRGLIGMFELSITSSDDGTILYVRDVTAGVPVGFPAPRTLTTTQYKNFAKTNQISRVQAIRLNYISNETELTFKIQRLIQTTNDLGNGLEERIDNTVFDFYSLAFPTTVLRTLPDLLEKTTKQDGVTIGYSTERYTYNSENRPTQVVRTQEALLPTTGIDGTIDENLTPLVQRFRDETTQIQYGSHPFIPRAVYQQQIVTRTTGLVVKDTENQYLGQDFIQAIDKAHEAGNVKDGMTVATQNIETQIENFTPQPNGQMKSELRIIDHTRNDLTRTPNSDERAGDGALSQAGSSTQRLLVFDNASEVLSGGEVEDFNVGELPLYLAIPLTVRKLKRMRNYLGNVAAELLGLDLDIIDGTTIALQSREAEPQGSIIVNSIQIQGNGLGTENQDISQTIQGERIIV